MGNTRHSGQVSIVGLQPRSGQQYLLHGTRRFECPQVDDFRRIGAHDLDVPGTALRQARLDPITVCRKLLHQVIRPLPREQLENTVTRERLQGRNDSIGRLPAGILHRADVNESKGLVLR